MKRKGFTLVELLGVIIILSILALIVVPNVIDSVKSKSVTVSKIQEEMIVKAAGVYVSDHEGLYPKTTNNTYCIALSDMVADDYLDLSDQDIISEKSVKVSYTSKYTYDIIDRDDCKQKRIYTPATDEEIGNNPKGNFEIGDAYDVYVNDTDIYRFYILSVDNENNTVNLIMNKNIYYNSTTDDGEGTSSSKKGLIPWYDESLINSNGPVDALEYLYKATKNWTNVTVQDINYKDENMGITNGTFAKGSSSTGYNSIVTSDQVTKIYSKSSTTTLSVGTTDKPLRATLPNMQELVDAKCTETYLTCPKWLYNNLKEYSTASTLNNIDGISGYWVASSTNTTSTNQTSSSTASWTVQYTGSVSGDISVNNTTEYGVRPVITVSKYDLDPYYTVPYTIDYDCDSNDCTTFQTKVKRGQELTVEFDNPPLRLLVQKDGENFTDYTYTNGKLYIARVDGNMKITCLENEYIVTYNNISNSSQLPSTVKKNKKLSVEFNGTPVEVTVYENNTKLSSDNYTFNKTKGTLTKTNVTGDIHIVGHFPISYIDVPGSDDLVKTWEADTKLEIQMPLDSYNEYPYQLLITMGGTVLTDSSYTYSNVTGKLVINKVTGALVITRQRREYTITYSNVQTYEDMQAKIYRHDNLVFANTQTVKVYKSDGTINDTKKAPISYPSSIQPTKVTTTMNNESGTAVSVTNFTYESNKYTLNDVTGDVNITAYYKVTYNANGDSKNPASSSVSNVVIKGGENTTLPTATRSGFKFLGWSTSATGTKEYNAGDTYSTYKNVTLYAVWQDTTPPTCTITLSTSKNSNGWRNKNTVVTITYNDNVEPAVKQYSTSADSTRKNYTSAITQTQTSGITYTGYVSDAAGNTNTCTTETIKIDTTSPTCSVAKSNTGTTTGVNTTVTCSDSGGSTCATSTQSDSNLKSSKTYTVKDYAGNSGTCTATITAVNQKYEQTRSVASYNRCSSCGCETYKSCYKKVSKTCGYVSCTAWQGCTAGYSQETGGNGVKYCVYTSTNAGDYKTLKKNALTSCQSLENNRVNTNDTSKSFWTIISSCVNNCSQDSEHYYNWICKTTMKHWVVRKCTTGDYYAFGSSSTSYPSSCSANSISCSSSTSGKTNVTCSWGAYSGCGCQTYKACSSCGVASYTSWSSGSWVNGTCGTTTDTYKCQSRVIYN